ncbi:MAG: sugar transferase [Burkholderiales bacterium]|nr:sugar transferase [Burkholderiales bacterium]
MGKRLLDVVAAALGLLLLLPLFLVIAAAIKLESPGPVFFRQERVGRHGRPFRIFKFRTMATAAAANGPQVTAAGDSRVTAVGAWLRRFKLDELAQLIDVLRGTMSLVGPRPEVPRFVEHYPPEWRERLLSVRPGITDFASVRYRDEGELLAAAADPEREYIEVVLPAKLQYALDYVDNPTMGTDLRVLGLTLRTVFAPTLPSPRRLFMNDSKLWSRLDQLMSAVHPRNRAVATVADGLVILVCWHVTYLFRLGFERWQPGRPWYDDYVSFGVVAVYLVFLALTGVPRGLWRFFGFDDFRRIAIACVLAGLTSATAILLAQLAGVARAVLLLHPLFCMVGLSLSRMIYRLIAEQARAQVEGADGEPRRAIVLGAGEAGRRLVSGIHRRDGWIVLALLDDDPAKQGLRIGGVTVSGTLPDLLQPHVLAGATHVIIAMPDAPDALRERTLEMARQSRLPVLTVPGKDETHAQPVS